MCYRLQEVCELQNFLCPDKGDLYQNVVMMRVAIHYMPHMSLW